MTIDLQRVVDALATPTVPAEELWPVARRFLTQTENYELEYADFSAFERARGAIAKLGASERLRRALDYARAWAGSSDIEINSRFARAAFAQGINFSHLDPEEGCGPDALWWPSVADISSYDVQGLMDVAVRSGGSGDALADCIAFAVSEPDAPQLESARQLAKAVFCRARERLDDYEMLSLSFASPRRVNDRLLELMLARPGDPERVPMGEVVTRMLAIQSGTDVETHDVCSRWLEARGHARTGEGVTLGDPSVWDGGHASGATAAQRFLARVWSAADIPIDEVAAKVIGRVAHAEYKAAVCASLPFEQKETVTGERKSFQLFRVGRLVVTRSAAPGKGGRANVKLHATVAKAEADARRKLAKSRRDLL